MRSTTTFLRLLAIATLLAAVSTTNAWAGHVFITGHDPDFHTQNDLPGAGPLFETGLNYVTNGTWNTPGHKFLWVESNLAPTPGHLVGEDGLLALGLVAGVNFDQVDAAGLASVNFANYSAIAVASSFGGMLSQAEIDELIARKTDIQNYVNSGGGVFASSECGIGFASCLSDQITNNSSLFGFLPVTATSIDTAPPYSITPFGTSIGAAFGLTSANLNDPTHNSFGPVVGLNAVDLDQNGNPTTLAGDVNIGGGGFTPAPEPSSLLLLGSGLAGLVGTIRRKLRQ